MIDVIIHYLDRAIACDSGFLLAYQNKLMVLKGQRRFDEAVLVCDDLLKFNVNKYIVLIQKGILLEKLGKKEDAYFTYSVALKEAKLKEQSETDIIVAKWLLGDSLNAIDSLELIKKKAGNDTVALNKLIEALRTKSRNEVLDIFI